jgi:hypothetical protein
MRYLKALHFVLLLTFFQAVAAPSTIHVWEMQELTFIAKNSYKNP